MTLTAAQKIEQEADRILTLIGTLSTLRSKPDDAGYPQNMQPAIDALRAIADFPKSVENGERASQAVMAVVNAVMDEALDQLAGVADAMSPAGAEVKRVRETAKTANRDLILPKVASVSATALASMQTLLDAVKKLDADDLEESAVAMDTIVQTLKQLIESLPDG